MPGELKAFFLPGAAPAGGHRMAVLRLPAGIPRGAVLHVHAFAEELNKTRRMVAVASRALAGAGYAVLQVDLYGCGDSSGTFAEASWEQWQADVAAAAQWLVSHYGNELWLWGTRAGCLLAVHAAARMSFSRRLLFWQPQLNGKLALQQFLRLKMANQMAQGVNKGVTESLRRQLEVGQHVDVAGYQLGAALARGLESASLEPPMAIGAGDRLVWLEVTSRQPAVLSPASAAALLRWQVAGAGVEAAALNGPPFWQTLEIEEAPALIDATVASILAATSATRAMAAA